MKKTYISPEISVIELYSEDLLLKVSDPALCGELDDEDDWD